ncbi:unnamed protein product [Dicrocoelium dendriticum]|nr:unnamed protein product [Dicrocoelium dendriticum]
MSVQSRLENVNEGNVFVCFCLFWWIMLLGAHADGILILPYWALFTPLWVWKLTVIFGCTIGLAVWLRQRTFTTRIGSLYDYNDPVFPHIQAMCVTTFFILLLCCSEILLCLHLCVPSLQLAYLTILTPVLLVGLLGTFGFFFLMIDSRSMFFWANRRRARTLPQSRLAFGPENPLEYNTAFTHPHRACSFTLGLFIAVNLLQLFFLISRLDNWIRSSWVVTFIPTFVLLGLGFIFCAIGLIVALMRYFTAYFIPLDQRRLPVYYYAAHIFIDLLLFTAVVFLVLRLDRYLPPSQVSYSLICTPVLVSLIIYAANSLCHGPGNPCWFGVNRNILLALFETCPALQLCANTSVSPTGLWKSTANAVHTDNNPTGGDSDASHHAEEESTSEFHSHVDTDVCSVPFVGSDYHLYNNECPPTVYVPPEDPPKPSKAIATYAEALPEDDATAAQCKGVCEDWNQPLLFTGPVVGSLSPRAVPGSLRSPD